MDDARIAIRFGRLKPALIALGLPPGWSYLDVGAELVHVRMSWAFQADVPLRSIRYVHRVRNSINIGVHGLGGRWLVNGASGPLVALVLEPPARARVLGLPIRLRTLIVSLDDPDAALAMLSPRTQDRALATG